MILNTQILNSQIFNAKQMTASHQQQKGLVLFMALIALVAMSLAAAALIRSVDTTVLVAGNLAFKQSAIMSGDNSLSMAATYIESRNVADLQTDFKAEGYHATAAGLDYSDTATWSDANSELAAGPSITAGVDTSGNMIRYIVERMCKTTGEATAINCLIGLSPGAIDHGICGSGGCPATSSLSVIYRVTSRVTGPKNTVSYIQAYVY